MANMQARVRSTSVGQVEFYTTSHDGIERNIDTLARLSPDDAEAYVAEIVEAIAKARENERKTLEGRRQNLEAEAFRIREQLAQVTSQIAEIHAKQEKLHPSPEQAGNGKWLVRT